MRTAPPLLLPLFRSAGQARILAAAYLGSETELSVANLASSTGLSYATAHREVSALVAAGLLADRKVGNVRMVRANESSPSYGPLRDLLEVSLGAVPLLRAALADVGGIEIAGVFGSYAARSAGVAGASPQDVDLLVIGTPSLDDVYDACTQVSRVLGHAVNPTVLSKTEWQAGSAFISDVLAHPYLPIIGDLSGPSAQKR
jgi:DNA-binding transcriptional ArsR family regulator